MPFQIFRQSYSNRAKKILNTLQTTLKYEYSGITEELKDYDNDPHQVKILNEVLLYISELIASVNEQLSSVDENNLSKIHKALNKFSKKIAEYISENSSKSNDDRLKMSFPLGFLLKAESELGELVRQQKIGSEFENPIIEIHTDLLFQAYHSLFPAERMLVASGRMTDSGVCLGAVFDVTGKASAGHVQADPTKMANALISMSLSNTHLAAWFHSHPGKGKMVTNPSSIDQRQYRDWLCDYSRKLVSVIFVSDRWFRIWGSALDKGEYQIKIVGGGVSKGDEDEHIYRFTN